MFCAGYSDFAVLSVLKEVCEVGGSGRRWGQIAPGGSVMRGDGVTVACARPLIALACVLLAEKLRLHPEVAAHLQVEAAFCARVALGVAESVVDDPDCLGDNVVAAFFTNVVFLDCSGRRHRLRWAWG